MCRVHVKEVSDAFCDCEDDLMDDFQFAVGVMTDQIEMGTVEIFQYPTGTGGLIEQLQASIDESNAPLQAIVEVQTLSGETLHIFHAATGGFDHQLQTSTGGLTQQLQGGTGGGSQQLLVNTSGFIQQLQAEANDSSHFTGVIDVNSQHNGASEGVVFPQTEQAGPSFGLAQHIQQVVVAAMQDFAQSEGSAISASN